jgi:HlyD family secretion protein
VLPQGNVVALQASHSGVVLEVFAHAGDHLEAGAEVAEIDVSEADINLAQLRRKLALDQSQLALQNATLARLDRVIADPEVMLTEKQSGTAIAGGAYQSLNALENAEAKRDSAAQEERLLPERKQQVQQESELTKQRLGMLTRNRAESQRALTAEEQALTRKKDQLTAVRRLADNKLLSVVELNTEEERYRAAESSLINGQQRVDQMDVDISNTQLKLSELLTKLQTLDNETQNNLRAARTQYDQALANLKQERESVQIMARGLEAEIEHSKEQIALGESRLELATIRMPVTGTIADLKLHNAGELVAAGASVATIVPNDVELMVEANAPDKDIGFVRPGIDARIKVDAFPFQQFGTVRAKVVKVLPAFGGNSSFIVQLDLLDNKLTANGSDFYLFPGLSVQADLITREQRLLEVLLKGQDPGGQNTGGQNTGGQGGGKAPAK